MTAGFGWLAVVRLGLVQAALGAVVVLTTSTLNRVMVVELALPAVLPGLLVAWHYVVQIARPRMGFGSDTGARRTPWIVGGMAVLAFGGVLAAIATAWLTAARGPVAWLAIALAFTAFSLIGIGVSACGTSLLVLLAKRVDEARRASAATVVWLMMIVGFAVTAGVAGRLLDPYSPERLVAVTCGVSLFALALTLLAMRGLEGRAPRGAAPASVPVAPAPLPASAVASASAAAAASAGRSPRSAFRLALAEVWADSTARRFTIFVFVSMLAYSAQDLILEPFAGTVFGFTPGQSTQLSGVQHGGVLLGMLGAALAGRGRRFGSLRAWQVGGCLASALALLGLVGAGLVGPQWPFEATVFLLGTANGAFSIAAIASMMQLAGAGAGADVGAAAGAEAGDGPARPAREGIRMGLWGAAQALAFGFGGVLGTGASDLARWLVGDPALAYSAVFGFEAVLFVAAAGLAASLHRAAPRSGIVPARRAARLQPRGIS